MARIQHFIYLYRKPALLTICIAAFIVLAYLAMNSNIAADERGVLTPVAEAHPTVPVLETPVAVDSPVPGAINEDEAIAIAYRVASLKGDANAVVVAVDTMSLTRAIAELSPGMILPSEDQDEPVFVIRMKGGPFWHARSVPINRNPDDFMTNGLFVVISIASGDVIGTGGIRY